MSIYYCYDAHGIDVGVHYRKQALLEAFHPVVLVHETPNPPQNDLWTLLSTPFLFPSLDSSSSGPSSDTARLYHLIESDAIQHASEHNNVFVGDFVMLATGSSHLSKSCFPCRHVSV